ncbi:MAG: hypothetical protein JSS25_05320 [Proteobacteria bacterium]|nr:hypothetical protein [Pseudomonadota bacterium]
MTYTYEQVLAYEVASELANTHIADYSAAIGEEEKKACPDQAQIDQLREASLAIALERRVLPMTDDEAVARFTAKYARTAFRREAEVEVSVFGPG